MKRRLTRAVVVVAAAACTFVSPAFAQLTAQDHDRARALLAEGRNKRAAGDQRGALESFRAAHEIEHLPTTGTELGKTLIALGQLVEARELLAEIAKAPANAGEPPPLAAARADARDLVDALERKIPTLTVRLSSPPDETLTATVDGSPAAIDLLLKPRRINPGSHVVVLRTARGLEERTEVTLADGESREIVMKTPHDVIEPPPRAPLTPLGVSSAAPPPPASRSHVIAWVAGGIGIAALGTGTATGIVAAGKTSDLEPFCPGNSCPPDRHDELRTANTFAVVSTVSFVVASVCAAVVLWDLLRSPASAGPSASAPALRAPRFLAGSF